MVVELAWDGFIIAPGWTELQVNLRNEGSDWTGELRIQQGTDTDLTYHQALELPAHSNKTYRIPLFDGEQSGNFKVTLRDAQGQDLRQKTPRLQRTATNTICAIASPHDIGSGKTLTLCDKRILLSDLSALPESAMVWDNIHFLFLNGSSTADLTPLQQQALLTWVAQGGHLIISGGAALSQSLDGLPTELQIATLTASENLNNLPTSIIANGTTIAPQLILEEGTQPFVPVTLDKNLTAQRAIGRGDVTILSWDIVQAESLVWFSETWETLYPTNQIYFTKPTFFNQDWGSYQRILNVPSDEIPRMWRWFIFFPIYILLMGPGTWFIVRRLKRPILTWIILPAWIVVGIIIIALELSGLFSHTFPLTQEIAYIDATAPGLPARVVQGSAVYAPRTQNLRWTNSGSPRPLAGQYDINSGYGRGYPYELDITFMNDHYEVNIPRSFGVMTWGTEGTTYAPTIDHDLYLTLKNATSSGQSQEPFISGQLQSDITMRNVSLLLADGLYTIQLTDILTAGLDFPIDVVGEYDPTPYRYYGYYEETICNPRQLFPNTANTRPSVLMSNGNPNPLIKNTQSCHLLAEIDSAPFPAQNLSGNTIAASCVIYTIPCPTQTEGAFEVNLRANSNLVKGGWVDYDGDAYIEYPSTEITYVLPEFLQVSNIDELSILFDISQYDSTTTTINDILDKIELWNWQNEKWEEQPVPDTNTILNLTKENVLPYVEELATVRLRLIPKTTDGTHIYIEMKAKGQW